MLMEHEQNAKGAHKVLLAFFALFIGGIIVVLISFVVQRLGSMKDTCAAGVNGIEIGEVCGDSSSEE